MEDTFDKGFTDFEKKVREMIERIVRRILLKIQRDADKIIRDNKAIATAEMLKNLRSQVYQEASKIVGVVGVGANVPYAIYRHEGTKPHFPPVDDIKRWVVKKGIFRDSKGKSTTMKRVKKSGHNEESRLNAIAFLIARKISRKGTTGIAFLRMALETNLGYIKEQLTSKT